MKIHIAGINHFDPLCRICLIDWLIDLSSRNITAPAFIAVEADEHVYRQLLLQRDKFRQMLEKDFPKLQPDVRDKLVLSLYYEADTHPIVFPASKVLWLDNDRVFPANTLNDYAADRLNIYKRFLDKDNPLNKISEQKWNFDWNEPPTTPFGDPDYKRDYIFQKKIQDMCVEKSGFWAIAIVGASHAADRDQSMRQLLIKRGINCNADILNKHVIKTG